MIVLSFLLILVAVSLLVSGLIVGSSTVLVCSIALSLVAAVALVIGARRTANLRREAAVRAGAMPPVAAPVPALAGTGGVATYAEAGPNHRYLNRPAQAAFGYSGADGQRLDQQRVGQARGAGRDDAETALLANAAYRESGADFQAGSADATLMYDYEGDLSPRSDNDPIDDDRADRDHRTDHAHASGANYGQAADPDYGAPDPDYGAADPDYRTADPDYGQAADTDYGQAAQFIGAARSDGPEEHLWRRETDAGETPDDPTQDENRDDADRAMAQEPLASEAGAGAEFGEPDEDDPADEPLPQAVRPTDAVRISRLTDPVHVVDGRPRYHLADCAHLAERPNEPLSVAEAVELGFSPCGLCRPVDRLVTRTAAR